MFIVGYEVKIISRLQFAKVDEFGKYSKNHSRVSEYSRIWTRSHGKIVIFLCAARIYQHIDHVGGQQGVHSSEPSIV